MRHRCLSRFGIQKPVCPAQVLEALTEIAFEPELLASRMEKERRAVLAEAQMMNTIEYRVDCQLLQYLHAENALGSRFPIGKTEQARRMPGGSDTIVFVSRALHVVWRTLLALVT